MSVLEWFGVGVGAAVATVVWWRCVREGMWNIFTDSPGKNPSIPGGLIGDTAMFWTIPIWAPVAGVVWAWRRVDAGRLLTDRVFPRLDR